MSKTKSGQGKIRYRLIYRLGSFLATFLLRKYRFDTNKIRKTDENYLVVSNHLTELDWLILAAAFKEHMYFVAGEHLLRNKFGPKAQKWQDTIFVFKDAVALDGVRTIVRRIKDGNNVVLFPEGSRSFSGVTEKLPTSIGKLAKLTGAGLITYRIVGGYFVAPRWAYTFREGPVRGEIVHVYTAEEIRGMSPQEVTDHINADIYENAYDRQRKDPQVYKGVRLAEGLENYLVKCPVCGGYDTLKTEDDRFYCTACDLAGRYTEEAFLVGENGADLPYDTVMDWGKWCENSMREDVLAMDADKPCFTDANVTLYEVFEDHTQKDLLSGEVIGYRDRIEIGGEVFAFADTSNVTMLYYGKSLLLNYQGRHLGITGEAFHAIKYQTLYDVYGS